jgi:hypothetical protein
MIVNDVMTSAAWSIGSLNDIRQAAKNPIYLVSQHQHACWTFGLARKIPCRSTFVQHNSVASPRNSFWSVPMVSLGDACKKLNILNMLMGCSWGCMLLHGNKVAHVQRGAMLKA